MSGAELVTFGCRLNIAESEAMRAIVGDQDDLVIVNSCAVTAEAVRQAKKAIRRVARERPEARIVVTGCAAQIEPAGFAAMRGVAGIVPNRAKLDPASFGVATGRPALPSSFAGHARAFVDVQNGCDHRCTFCIIPAGRGESRSVDPAVAVDRIAALVEAGHREVVLTGVDLTSYASAAAPTLGHLVEHILRGVPQLPRLRLSSLDPPAIDPRLFALLVGEPRLMPHVHLSLQAGDDMILKRMRRRHSRAEAVALVERLKAARPEIAVGADLIAGFPTEDEAMAANSLAMIEDCDIVFGHVFPYSPRHGTPAARMPQVPPPVARARAKALRETAATRKAVWLRSLVETEQRVLIERDGATGHAENFARVRLAPSPRHSREGGNPWQRDASPPNAPSMDPRFRGGDGAGALVKVRIIHVEDETLIGLPA